MWEYWFEAIVLVALLGIWYRVRGIHREVGDLHDCFHHFESIVFDEEQVEVTEGRKLRVLELEEFMDEFGFDPRKPPLDEEESSNTAAIEAWDNAKL